MYANGWHELGPRTASMSILRMSAARSAMPCLPIWPRTGASHCAGLVSQYNSDDNPVDGINLLPVLLKGWHRPGLHPARLSAPAWVRRAAKLGQWLGEGKITYHADITDGLENALDCLPKTLFKSGASHKGKMMIRVDPSAS